MTGPNEAEPAGAPDLRLRGESPRVMRLSRRALATAGLVASVGIGGALLYALQPSVPKGPGELYQTESRATTDALASAPKDYSQIPRLGPPLPGDLGRPILSAQQRGVDVGPPQIGQGPQAQDPGRNDAQAARDRLRQERDSARTGKLFVGGEGGTPPTSGAGNDVVVATMPAADKEQAAPVPATGDQAAKRNFLAASQVMPAESGFRLASPSSPYLVQAGSVISAALITGIRSELPGVITAQVTMNVYDSVSGHHLLIPQGSRLIGEYDSQISFGQNRVLLAWDRLILPDGRSIQLDRLPGADMSGNAGLQDRVDQHWGGLFRAALISTLLGVGTEVGSNNDDDLIRAIRRGGSDSIGRTGQDLVRRQMAVQPTLTIRPGFPISVIVTRDLVLAPSGGEVR